MVTVSNEVWLKDKFSSREWFDSVGRDNFGRLVVYVTRMSFDILTEIPLDMGERILVAFANSKHVTADTFKSQLNRPSLPAPEPESLDELFEEDVDTSIESIGDLRRELENLEKICGSNILQDIFYEVHDGSNAVTNLSSRYPDVKARVEKIYDEYGFDVIYEELDG